MFEAYTESARKSFTLARFEAIRFLSATVEVEHLFLGMLRADQNLAFRLFKDKENSAAVRQRIVDRLPPSEDQALSPSADLPLSRHCTRVISYAAAEAENLHHTHITVEHILLGILREKNSATASVLDEFGITIPQLQQEAVRSQPDQQLDGFRNLVAAARQMSNQPLVGRDRELAQMSQILCRRRRNNVALIGDPGVGKDALVRALAQRIARGEAPLELADRPILQMDASEFLLRRWETHAPAMAEIEKLNGAILYVRGLLDLRQPLTQLAATLAKGYLQIITTGSPLGFRLAFERNEVLALRFEVLNVPSPTEEQAIEILMSAKEPFEAFHDLTYSPEAIRIAVSASGRYLPSRALPDRALDLLDDAGALVKLRLNSLRPILARARARLARIAWQMEQQIAQHNFQRVKELAQWEAQERQNFERLQAESQPNQATGVVTPDDILEIIAQRTSLTLEAVKSGLNRPADPNSAAEIQKHLAARIPPGRRDWVNGLASYLADCSSEDADYLQQAIQDARRRLSQH